MDVTITTKGELFILCKEGIKKDVTLYRLDNDLVGFTLVANTTNNNKLAEGFLCLENNLSIPDV